MYPLSSNSFPTIETDRLLLRNVNKSHAPFILEHFSDESVDKYLYDEETFTNIDQAHALVDWYAQPESKGYNRWVLEDKESGERPVGTCGYHAWDRSNHIAEIGYDLSPLYWGRGYMKEALIAVINSGFQNMNLNRIHAYVALQNDRSINLLQALGFKREGIYRDKHYYQGAYYDHYTYSLLRREW